MEKMKLKEVPVKNASFYNKCGQNSAKQYTDSEMRLGISEADEQAKDQLRKTKIEAPPSIEERIFRDK